MNRVFCIIKLVFLVISVLLCLAIPVAGVISTITSWEGICDDANGLHDCPWWEYAGFEMLWVSFLFIPLLFGAALVWLVMAALQFIVAKVQRRKEKTTPPNMSF